jgi:hypothetical protein
VAFKVPSRSKIMALYNFIERFFLAIFIQQFNNTAY